MDDDRKIAAAMAAVNRYLEMESAQAALAEGAVAADTLGQAAAPGGNIWGVSGRQDQMQLRRMMQLRTFK